MRLLQTIRHYLIGRPLLTRAVTHERLTNAQGLAIFASDALSSTAYATEEILLVLVGGGLAALYVSLPIAMIIGFLILLVSFSYHQVIHAYPQGGGVYNVARSNLGEFPALLGASSLLVDYVLTAAVSVAAGVAAITSAFPALFDHRVFLGALVILFLTWTNLKGVRESGRIFSIPTYIFVFAFLGMIGYGVWKYFSGTFPVVPQEGVLLLQPMGAIGIILLLRAFASGCTAMTGIEAISNGVQAFKHPEAENAAKTLTRMALLLAIIFLGITLLAYWGKVVPVHDKTVVSQIAEALFGRNSVYFLIQGATALILLLAANTPFAGFPRVASQLARDGYFPRQFFNLGARLVFTNGIIALSLAAAFLLWLFGGNVHSLIPLYAVGVFLGFSLSQLGMVVYWLKDREGRPPHLDHETQYSTVEIKETILRQGWKALKTRCGGKFANILLNFTGLAATAIVFVIVFFSKFTHGAWILVPALAALVIFMKTIKKHYVKIQENLALDGVPLPEIMPDKTMVLLVSRIDRAALHALQFAKSFNPAHIRAVHVAINQEKGEQLKKEWGKYAPDTSMDVVHAEYRDIIGSVLDYLKKLDRQWPDDSMVVVIPQVVPERFWHQFLHNQTALRFRFEIDQDPDIHAEILEVPVKTTTKLRV